MSDCTFATGMSQAACVKLNGSTCRIRPPGRRFVEWNDRRYCQFSSTRNIAHCSSDSANPLQMIDEEVRPGYSPRRSLSAKSPPAQSRAIGIRIGNAARSCMAEIPPSCRRLVQDSPALTVNCNGAGSPARPTSPSRRPEPGKARRSFEVRRSMPAPAPAAIQNTAAA